MDATQNARSFSKDARLRRHILDCLAVGHSVSIETCNANLAANLVEIGNKMGAKISVRNSMAPGKPWTVSLDPAAGSTHFDLYTMN